MSALIHVVFHQQQGLESWSFLYWMCLPHSTLQILFIFQITEILPETLKMLTLPLSNQYPKNEKRNKKSVEWLLMEQSKFLIPKLSWLFGVTPQVFFIQVP